MHICLYTITRRELNILTQLFSCSSHVDFALIIIRFKIENMGDDDDDIGDEWFVEDLIKKSTHILFLIFSFL